MTAPDILDRPATALGLIDADIHPRNPRRADLAPHASAYWAEMFDYRSIDRLELMSQPEGIGLHRHLDGPAANATPDAIARLHLNPAGVTAGILNVMSGAHAAFDPYLAAALCEATNRWLAADWLEADPRLRAAALVSFIHPEAAAAEIARLAPDRRFVSVLTPLMGEKPLGRREFWPIYRAMSDHGFALAVHAGSTYRHAPTQSGYLSTRVEEASLAPQAFASQVASLVAEGVFAEFPDLKVVLIDSGVTWLPSLMWRMTKDWKGIRIEVPWVKEAPTDIIARHIRLTTQAADLPANASADPALVDRVLGQFDAASVLIHASDFPRPHAQGPGLPGWLPARLHAAVARDTALATFSRLEV
jgi:predicted TIM-barrel fold metal-dependent hydrolase